MEWGYTRDGLLSGDGGYLIVHGSDHETVRKVFSERHAWLMSDDAARATRKLGMYA